MKKSEAFTVSIGVLAVVERTDPQTRTAAQLSFTSFFSPGNME
jgi:hypothetical protein